MGLHVYEIAFVYGIVCRIFYRRICTHTFKVALRQSVRVLASRLRVQGSKPSYDLLGMLLLAK